MITNDGRCTGGMKSRTAIAKAALNKITFFISKLELNIRKTLIKCYIWSRVFMVLKLGHFGKQIRNAWKVLKCGAGEDWILSVGLNV
jgi:hypothetical protein